MIYAILDNIIIMLITVICLFTSASKLLLIFFAGLLAIIVTYMSLSERTSGEIIIKGIGFCLFSLASTSFIGFIIFALFREVKLVVRLLISSVLFVITSILFMRYDSVAEGIMDLLFMFVGFGIITIIYSAIHLSEERKNNDSERLLVSNINALHEKRLNEQLVLQNVMAEKNARLMERENISRNIHNSVGHSITAAIMTLDAADMLYDVKPEEARKKMNTANERIRGSLESIRRAVRVLDDDTIEILAEDLKSEMDTIIDEFVMDTSIKVNQQYEQLPSDIKLPRDYVEFLTGVLQEMLTNGVKHGNANEFIVLMFGDSGHIRIEISDNGKSDFDDNNYSYKIENGFGLKKIISYVEKHGGKTEFNNNNGFKSVVELPIV